MPRARNIKPSLFLNEILGKADPLLTLLFISLWGLADREGRLEDRPARIKAETFPYRPDVDIERSLNELQRSGFITRYKTGDKAVIQVIHFKKHQSPHHTEKQSTLPPIDSNSLILKEDEKLTDKSTLNTGELPVVKRSDLLIPDLLIPDTGYLITEKAPTREKELDLEFEKFWQAYPKRPGANKTQALKAWNARRKEGHIGPEMIWGAVRYAEYCRQTKREPEFIKQAATFLGPDKHFTLEWKASATGSQAFVDRLTGRSGDDDEFTFDT